MIPSHHTALQLAESLIADNHFVEAYDLIEDTVVASDDQQLGTRPETLALRLKAVLGLAMTGGGGWDLIIPLATLNAETGALAESPWWNLGNWLTPFTREDDRHSYLTLEGYDGPRSDHWKKVEFLKEKYENPRINVVDLAKFSAVFQRDLPDEEE